MGERESLCFLACLCQVIFFFEQHLNPVEIELVFKSFLSAKDLDSWTVSCRTGNNCLVYEESIDGSACLPDCRVPLRLVEDPSGYIISLRVNKNDVVLEEKTFYFIPPVPASFLFDLVQVTEQQVELSWSDLSPLNLPNLSTFQIYLQNQEEGNEELGQGEVDRQSKTVDQKGKKSQSSPWKNVRVPISLTSREVTQAGLSPGSIFFFTLGAVHPAGSTWSLGQLRTAYSRPLAPQNVTVGSITTRQMSVPWMRTHFNAGWNFSVCYLDMSTMQQMIVGVNNISRISDSGSLQLHTAVIGVLESYRKYMIEVFTVTRHGIENCRQAPITVRTALMAPAGLVVLYKTENLTACWTSPPDDPTDGYYITFHPLFYPTPTSLWINQSNPVTQWVNGSVCVSLGKFTPDQSYEVGVVSLRGRDRSSITHTTDPTAVEVAFPLSVGTKTAQVYIQRPQQGLIDGVKTCICPGACVTVCAESCVYTCHRYFLPDHVDIITLHDLRTASEYQLMLYSTSRKQMGPPYHARPVKTGVAPPNRLREGVVTDSSIEVLWDPAQGQAHSYEVICLDCEHPHMVQKVYSHTAVFSSPTLGRLYHFSLGTEKESFKDSLPFTINITAAQSPVVVSLVNKTTTSINICWSTIRGVLSGLVLSIKNRTSNQEVTISHQESRLPSFEGLAPGSQYTTEVTCTGNGKKSKSTKMILHTVPDLPPVVTSVLVTWRPPLGQVDGYKVVFGLQSQYWTSWTEKFIQSTSYEIKALIPGSDYSFSIQCALGSDTSPAVQKEFSTRPAGISALHLTDMNGLSLSVSWDYAFGEFDFSGVAVANASVTDVLTIPKREWVAVVTGLVDGCSYNLSAERVRGETSGSAAFLKVITARVQGLCLVNVSECTFLLRWDQAVGSVDHYQVDLKPNQGDITVHPARDGYIQVFSHAQGSHCLDTL